MSDLDVDRLAFAYFDALAGPLMHEILGADIPANFTRDEIFAGWNALEGEVSGAIGMSLVNVFTEP